MFEYNSLYYISIVFWGGNRNLRGRCSQTGTDKTDLYTWLNTVKKENMPLSELAI